MSRVLSLARPSPPIVRKDRTRRPHCAALPALARACAIPCTCFLPYRAPRTCCNPNLPAYRISSMSPSPSRAPGHARQPLPACLQARPASPRAPARTPVPGTLRYALMYRALRCCAAATPCARPRTRPAARGRAALNARRRPLPPPPHARVPPDNQHPRPDRGPAPHPPPPPPRSGPRPGHACSSAHAVCTPPPARSARARARGRERRH